MRMCNIFKLAEKIYSTNLIKTILNIQVESGGEGNILGDDSMGYCKKNLY